MNQKYVERLFKGLHFTFRIIEKMQSKKKSKMYNLEHRLFILKKRMIYLQKT